MSGGWLKLHRSILESAVFCDSDVLKAWIWLLLNATHKDIEVICSGKPLTLKSGQLITGRKRLAEVLGVNETKCYRILNTLKELGNIEIKPNNKFSLITIVNWDKFQTEDTSCEQQENNKRTTNEQQTNNKRTLKKNDKNDKKVKKERSNISGYEAILEGIEDESLRELYREYIKTRSLIKAPMTEKALTILIAKVGRLESSVERQKLLLETAIENNWKSVYPLKDGDVPKEETKRYGGTYV